MSESKKREVGLYFRLNIDLVKVMVVTQCDKGDLICYNDLVLLGYHSDLASYYSQLYLAFSS